MKIKEYWIIGVIALITGIVGGVIVVQFFSGGYVFAEKSTQQFKVIEVEEFRLIDKNGKSRAVFGQSKDGNPSLIFFDKDNNSRVKIAVGDDGGSVVDVLDKDGKSSIGLVVLPSGFLTLILSDKDGKGRGFFSLYDETPLVQFNDKNGRQRIVLGLKDNVESGSSLAFSGEDGTARSLYTDTGLLILDKKGKRRAGLGLGVSASEEVVSRLVLYDKNAHERVVIGALEEPQLILLDKKEEVIWKAP